MNFRSATTSTERRAARWGCLGLLVALWPGTSAAKNLGCLAGQCEGKGYAFYRSSNPGEKEWQAICGDWPTDIVVLHDDQWAKRSQSYRARCPNAAIVYADDQPMFTNLDTHFLALFDQVIQRAKAQDRKVLIHCRLGTHRTGRLAAYYAMKFEGWSLERAQQDFEQHLSTPTRLYASTLNRRVRRQVRSIAAFLGAGSACAEGVTNPRDCVAVRPTSSPKDPAVVEAELRVRVGGSTPWSEVNPAASADVKGVP